MATKNTARDNVTAIRRDLRHRPALTPGERDRLIEAFESLLVDDRRIVARLLASFNRRTVGVPMNPDQAIVKIWHLERIENRLLFLSTALRRDDLFEAHELSGLSTILMDVAAEIGEIAHPEMHLPPSQGGA